MFYDWTARAEELNQQVDQRGDVLRAVVPPGCEGLVDRFQGAVSCRAAALDLVWYQCQPIYRRLLWALQGRRDDQHA